MESMESEIKSLNTTNEQLDKDNKEHMYEINVLNGKVIKLCWAISVSEGIQ